MSSSNSIEALKGTWDYIDGDNLDGYLKALGLGFIGRIMAKTFKPRLVIVEQDGKWTLRTETGLKPTTIEFTENVEYDETTPGGHKLKGVIRFEDGKWIQKTRDNDGKESIITRWVDEKDQQQIIFECGQAKARRVYRRV